MLEQSVVMVSKKLAKVESLYKNQSISFDKEEKWLEGLIGD